MTAARAKTPNNPAPPDIAPSLVPPSPRWWVFPLVTTLSFITYGFAFPHVGPLWTPEAQRVLCKIFFILPQPVLGLLAHVALAPMIFAALREKSHWRVVWVSYLLALTWWLFMIKWLMLVTTGGTIGACCVMALYNAGSLLGIRLWRQKLPRIPLILSFPMIWTTLEMLRGFAPAGGFGWFALGHSQAPYDPAQGVSWFVQIADLFAEHGVTFVVAMSNAALAEVMLYLTDTKPDQPRRTWPHYFRSRAGVSVTFWFLVILFANVYGWFRIHPNPDQISKSGITVAVVQTNVPVSNSEDHQETSEEREEHWETLKKLTLSTAETQPSSTDTGVSYINPPNLIVWPETMVPAALNKDAREYYLEHHRAMVTYYEQIADLVRTLKTDLIVGADAEMDYRPYTLQLPSGPRHIMFPAVRYNAAYLFEYPYSYTYSDWKPPEEPIRYDKLHRVPFGEYIPWVDGWPWLKDIFIKYFSPYPFDFSIHPGAKVVVFDLYSVSSSRPDLHCHVATPICFEDAVPRAVRHLVYDEQGHKRVDILVNLTNDGWYPGTSQNIQHFQIAALRCIENRTPMARAVNTGPSGFIDSFGRVTKMIDVNGLRQQVQGAVTQTLFIDKRQTLYGTLGYPPMVIMSILTAILTLYCMIPRFKPRTQTPAVV